MDIISIDKLSEEYISIRTEREIMSKKHKEEDAVLEGKLMIIEAQLLEAMRLSEASSISTSSATVIRRVSKRYSTTNWPAIYRLIKEHDAFGLLTQRISNANMQQFLEENPELYPEGLNVDSRFAVTVRRKSTI
jgi:hypothetical protein